MSIEAAPGTDSGSGVGAALFAVPDQTSAPTGAGTARAHPRSSGDGATDLAARGRRMASRSTADEAYRAWIRQQDAASSPDLPCPAGRRGGGGTPSPQTLLAVAERSGVLPGSELRARCSAETIGDLGEDVLVELVALGRRLAAWVEANQLDLVAEMVSRRTDRQAAEVPDELAARLSLTGYAASQIVHRAQALTAFPEVARALRDGVIDVRKVDVLIDGTTTLTGAQARAVHRRVLPVAAQCTTAQLRKKVAAAAIAIDPAHAEARSTQARRARSVMLTPAPDGMAWLTAFLPAARAVEAFGVIDALAGRDGPSDARPVDARRADAFSDIIGRAATTADSSTRATVEPDTVSIGNAQGSDPGASARPAALPTVLTVTGPSGAGRSRTADATPASQCAAPHGTAPSPPPTAVTAPPHGTAPLSVRRPPDAAVPGSSALPIRQGQPVHLALTVAATTLAGHDDLPGELAGYGPITASTARLMTESAARIDHASTDPHTGMLTDLTRRAAHPSPMTAPAAGSGAPGPGRPTGTSPPGTDPPRTGPTTPRLSPHDATAVQARPCGIRPSTPAVLVRRVLSSDHGRADPVRYLSESLGLLATDSYVPGAALRDFVLTRDRTCRFPGCEQPGARCQIDHIVPFSESVPSWAQTVETNLHLLCTRHHQLKTHHGWRARRTLDGTTHWRSPIGIHSRRAAHVADPRVSLATFIDVRESELTAPVDRWREEPVESVATSTNGDPRDISHLPEPARTERLLGSPLREPKHPPAAHSSRYDEDPPF